MSVSCVGTEGRREKKKADDISVWTRGKLAVCGLLQVRRDANIRSKECASIAGFYTGRNILVTGGTGFLGKVLLEKLLRSCPDVGEIFILMKPKRGLSIDDRLRKMLQLPVSRKEDYLSLSPFS